MPDAMRATIDEVGVRRLLASYADAVSCRDWDRVAHLFAEDAEVEVDTVTSPAHHLLGGRAVAEFISGAVERFEFFQFGVLNAHVQLEADDDPHAASGRVFVTELRQDRHSGAWSQTFGLYMDRYRRASDGWLFERRRYRSTARTGRNEVFPLPGELT
jgi:hypothetical protein